MFWYLDINKRQWCILCELHCKWIKVEVNSHCSHIIAAAEGRSRSSLRSFPIHQDISCYMDFLLPWVSAWLSEHDCWLISRLWGCLFFKLLSSNETFQHRLHFSTCKNEVGWNLGQKDKGVKKYPSSTPADRSAVWPTSVRTEGKGADGFSR